MGGCFSHEVEVDFDGPVNFNHFHILRAIGKGAFGKVCIVKKRDTKEMYAMKYMNKIKMINKHAVDNVCREIEILCILDHQFLVNLWYTFQDREDMFMVLDLMLGGDLSYHLEKEGRFQVPRVRLYLAEIALALEYLRESSIIHRDVKPANMLLDSQGHVHLTDFNVACIVRPDVAVLSITGTKPYMAPEVLHPTSAGYSFAVDWWSLGVSVYEMLRGQRPFTIDRHMSNSDIYSQLKHTRPSASASWDHHTCDVLKMLLHPDEDKRLQTVTHMMPHPFFESLDWEETREKQTTPTFIPPQNRINCDPTHELEEMIVEPNPLHKKQHRLSKRYKMEDESLGEELKRVSDKFRQYNRTKEKDEKMRKEREEREKEEEREREEERKLEREREEEEREREEERKREREREEEEKEEEEEEEEDKKEEKEREKEKEREREEEATENERLKRTEEESGDMSTSETQRTMSEETDNSQKDLIQ